MRTFAAETIAYSVTGSPLGRLLVARSRRGLCALWWGDDDEAMRAHLAERFPHADLRPDAAALAPVVERVGAYLEGDGPFPDEPLDPQGSPFQQAVWQALRAIPPGETRTYGEVARAVDRPRAVRAVARACAANPVSLIIPCHRVVRADGGLGGYRWGLGRKEALLARERRLA